MSDVLKIISEEGIGTFYDTIIVESKYKFWSRKKILFFSNIAFYNDIWKLLNYQVEICHEMNKKITWKKVRTTLYFTLNKKCRHIWQAIQTFGITEAIKGFYFYVAKMNGYELCHLNNFK